MTTVGLPESTDFPQGLSPSSLLGKYLTPQVWQALKHMQTSAGVSLLDCIASGLAHSDSVIGVYAGDEESLERFGLLFAPLIQDWHGCSQSVSPVGSVPEEERPAIRNPDPQAAFIRSTRIRLVRNVSGYRLMPTISRSELLAIQRQLQEVFGGFENELAGSYQALSAAQHDGGIARATGVAGFDGSDRFQQAAGICSSWPDGRGVFSTMTGSLQVWVNEEDHLRIISAQDGADIEAVYVRLLKAGRQLEQSVCFQQSPRYGYLASCPSNLGTGLRASFHIHLPLSGGTPEFKSLCARLGIAVRSAAGEAGRQQGALYDISNRRRLGLSPMHCLEELLAGTEKIIALEKQMQARLAAIPNS